MGSRIEKIVFSLPRFNHSSIEDFNFLKDIFKNSKVDIIGEQIVLHSTLKEESLPLTTFELSDGSQMCVKFILCDGTVLYEFGSNIFEDNIVKNGFSHLNLKQFSKLLPKGLGQIDHTGLVISEDKISRVEWDNLMDTLGSHSNFYSYPTGEDWPFMLPATKMEFTNNIEIFEEKRLPKFELVHMKNTMSTIIQIDMETEYTQKQLLELFPDPVGICFSGLEKYFRSIFVNTWWPGVTFRFDLRYNEEIDIHEWNSGKWLAQEGKRIL
ncbi:MAG: hypothetical protein HOO06_14555 [Bdellovibrionaceae bacterium]|jgi:hypothetical protein|nr:hypothetical protein [Pseudobdellovibrionaceae bacterium]